MSIDEKRRKTAKALLIAAIVAALIIGVSIGVAIAGTKNLENQENFTDFLPDLPSKLLDINGNLITEYSSEQKRELISIEELPRHLIYAVIAREDPEFYSHHGFTIKSILRAAWGRFIGKNLGGGSTISQQLAGLLYKDYGADRTDISYRRKIIELWYSFQLERRLTKNEILELYLNAEFFGSGTYGVEAASKFYFGHSAREITLAESAMLVIQLAGPAIYSPINHPNAARGRQRAVLDEMVGLGYVTKEAADESFADYWATFDYTRNNATAYYVKDDKAPWFSEYVRKQLDTILYGNLDYYKDGFVIHSTLNLDYQLKADKYMRKGIEQANETYKTGSSSRLQIADTVYVPISEMLSLVFDLDAIHKNEGGVRDMAFATYNKTINPAVDALTLLFGIDDLMQATSIGYGNMKTESKKTTVEGALVTVENDTGYILALVGGSEYGVSNQWIRATQSLLMPGSSFKPLYYSAAIDSRKFTEATLIYDSPVVFYNEDNTPYIPQNYKGEWKGPVLLWQALAHSMNVPSLKILDGIGFDAAISRAALLLGITDPDEIASTFQRYFPLGLGTLGVTPLKMARAYAVFANQGKEVTPIAIRQIEDRNGRIFLDPEKDLRLQQKKKGSGIQIISPQNAYIMTDLMKGVVQSGTLAGPTSSGSLFTYTDANNKEFILPVAGKTGTTENWADAWTVGYTPYVTTAMWFGFDLPGNSLGVNLTGGLFTAFVWAGYMYDINQGLPPKDFAKPQTGLVEVNVCAKSGLLPTAACDEGTIVRTFLDGTEPTKYCDLHTFKQERDLMLLDRLQNSARLFGADIIDQALRDQNLPDLDLPSPDSLVPESPASSTDENPFLN